MYVYEAMSCLLVAIQIYNFINHCNDNINDVKFKIKYPYYI